MATIQAFRPLRPVRNFPELKTLLETAVGQAIAYRNIRRNLEKLLRQEKLIQESSPGIYVYEISANGQLQTGIWALTALEDYTSGKIKIHELTFSDRVRRLKNYRENTGLEGGPVLLTYTPSNAIDQIIATAKFGKPVRLQNEGARHQLWKIEDRAAQEQLIQAFAQVPVTYLADGHHRLEAGGCHGYPFISSLYMDTDQLRIEAYHRIVIPDTAVSAEVLLCSLNQNFYIKENTDNQPVLPNTLHRFGMFLQGQWYHLLPKNSAPFIDALILQEQILVPIFGIEDPKTDCRLKYAGGEKALEEILGIFRVHPAAIAFTLFSMPVDHFIGVAEAGQILPPKSTWIVPKVPYGLLIHQHEL